MALATRQQGKGLALAYGKGNDRMVRPALASMTAVLLAACAAAPAPPSEQDIQTAIAASAEALPAAEETAFAQINEDLADDPEPVWRDKLSGQWLDTSRQTRTIWTIDLDGGTISFGMAGAGNSSTISFDREEGRTVYATITGTAATRTDSFRFLDDDTVIWTNTATNTDVTLKRE